MSHTQAILFIAIVAIVFAGCDSDGDDGPIDTARTFTVTVENVGMVHPVLKSGAVAQPAGMVPALEPGESATFSFSAPVNTVPGSGMRFNLATMFVQSNDLFYAFPPEGLALYDASGNAVTGDVTDQLFLYDAGTEVNGEPGFGPNQKLAQDPMAIDVGDDENGVVMLIEDGGTDVEGFSYPAKEDVIRVTLEHDAATSTFTVTVANVSTPGLIPGTDRAMGAVPLSPFAWAAHVDGYTLYDVGESASNGIELIAEDGFVAGMLGGMDLPPERGLADDLADVTGLIVPLSPVAYAVHDDNVQAFEVGAAASEGVELIAEDGFPAGELGGMDLPPESGFVEALMGLAGVSDVAAVAAPGGMVPALEPGDPGESVEFTVTAAPGDRLTFLSMYVRRTTTSTPSVRMGSHSSTPPARPSAAT